MEARYIKGELERELPGSAVFLDSDDLKDLRQLLDCVSKSAVLVVVQSAEILQRPWCLLEIFAAVEANIPIIAVNVHGKGYNFEEAQQFVTHLDTMLEKANPGAVSVLQQQGVDVLDVAYKLSSTVPNIISVPFDSCASKNAIRAAILDLLDAMVRARPSAKLPDDKEAWLKRRLSQSASTFAHGNPTERLRSNSAGAALTGSVSQQLRTHFA